jgi:hypothetical protein
MLKVLKIWLLLKIPKFHLNLEVSKIVSCELSALGMNLKYNLQCKYSLLSNPIHQEAHEKKYRTSVLQYHKVSSLREIFQAYNKSENTYYRRL